MGLASLVVTAASANGTEFVIEGPPASLAARGLLRAATGSGSEAQTAEGALAPRPAASGVGSGNETITMGMARRAADRAIGLAVVADYTDRMPRVAATG